MSESIVILGAARTPMGSFQGDFASLAAHDLGGVAIKATVERAGIGSLNEGQKVSFDLEQSQQGRTSATNLKLV